MEIYIDSVLFKSTAKEERCLQVLGPLPPMLRDAL